MRRRAYMTRARRAQMHAKFALTRRERELERELGPLMKRVCVRTQALLVSYHAEGLASQQPWPPWHLLWPVSSPASLACFLKHSGGGACALARTADGGGVGGGDRHGGGARGDSIRGSRNRIHDEVDNHTSRGGRTYILRDVRFLLLCSCLVSLD